MRKNIGFSFCVTILIISAALFALSANNLKQKSKCTFKNTELTYIVKNFNGKIGVFEKGKHLPFRVTELLVSDLPVGDQKLLNKGIEAHGQTELFEVLEDFCS